MAYKKEFGANKETINQTLLARNTQEQANEPQRQKIKLVLIGSSEVIKTTIHHFLVTGQAEAGDWSRIVPCPSSPGEMMSILVCYITIGDWGLALAVA